MRTRQFYKADDPAYPKGGKRTGTENVCFHVTLLHIWKLFPLFLEENKRPWNFCK